MDTKVEQPKRTLKDYQEARGSIEHLISKFDKVSRTTKANRTIRFQKDLKGDRLRKAGLLPADSGYYPIRLADTKLRREQPSYIKYLVQSRRTCIFELPDGSVFPDSELLEQDFTNKFRFTGWEIPFIRWIDGAQAHGWDCLELTLNTDCPGHFSFEHVGHDNLILAGDTENLQAQEVIARRVNLTPWQLEEFVENNGFNKEEVEKLISSDPNKKSQYRQNNIAVYKIYFREDKMIYLAWFNRTCGDWLKAPEPLYLGKNKIEENPVPTGQVDGIGQPINDYPKQYEVEYPFFILKYTENEDPVILNTQGRVETDEAYQEAITVLLTSFVNKGSRASNIYASPKAIPGNLAPSTQPKQLDTVLKSGQMFDRPVEITYLPDPSLSMMDALQRIVTLSQNEDQQVNYAALNRPDTEKTATEITMAQQESAELSSMQVILLSIVLRRVATAAFLVYQNRAAQGKLNITPKIASLLWDQLRPTTKQLKIYTIKSSGDIDVIQRAEYLKKRMQFWGLVMQILQAGPMIYSNPFVLEYLKDLLRSAFPEDATRYITYLDQANMTKQFIGKLTMALKTAITDDTGKIKPEYAQHEAELGQLIQQASVL